MLKADPTQRATVISRISNELDARIARLQEARRRLLAIAEEGPSLPPGVADYLALLHGIGLSRQWVEMEHDLWLLAFATGHTTPWP